MSEDSTKVLGNGDDKLDRIIEMLRVQSLRIEAVESRLTSLETKVDDRLKDTRPLWEGVQHRLDQIEERIAYGFEAVQSQLQILNKKMELMTQDIMQVRAEQRLLEERVDKLERKPS